MDKFFGLTVLGFRKMCTRWSHEWNTVPLMAPGRPSCPHAASLALAEAARWPLLAFPSLPSLHPASALSVCIPSPVSQGNISPAGLGALLWPMQPWSPLDRRDSFLPQVHTMTPFWFNDTEGTSTCRCYFSSPFIIVFFYENLKFHNKSRITVINIPTVYHYPQSSYLEYETLTEKSLTKKKQILAQIFFSMNWEKLVI